MASLLEVGTGFHQELTGRENIYMNGSILGMRRAEIARKFDEIVDFAEVEKFLDTPVKRYSSGMYVRLAFSVAAHLEPEILIADVVLAVGDIQFQKKCLGKMGDVSRSGRTVLFVSHNVAAIRQLTTRCILLQKGSVLFDGSPATALALYSDAAAAGFEEGADLTNRPRPSEELSRALEFVSLGFTADNSLFQESDDVELEIVIRAKRNFSVFRLSGTVFQADGSPVGSFFCADAGPVFDGEYKTARLILLGFRLAPGKYSLGLGIGEGNELTGHRDHDIVLDVLPFEVNAITGEGGTLANWATSWGPVRFPQTHLEIVSRG